MPYIKDADRQKLQAGSNQIENAGELNYFLTMVCIRYFKQRGGKYQQINDVLGALEGCKLEFYRRIVAVYEDEKIKTNGDVY